MGSETAEKKNGWENLTKVGISGQFKNNGGTRTGTGTGTGTERITNLTLAEVLYWNCWEKGHHAGNCSNTRRSSKEREHLRVQRDIRAPTGYQRRQEEQEKTKMAESAANLLREDDNDKFEGILG